jgi:hypothetical protein
MLIEQPVLVGQNLNQKTEDFSFKTGKVATDDSALQLVIGDMQRAEKFIMSRLWITEWRTAKAIYEAPVKQDYWRDTLIPRASNSFPMVAQHVRAILDQTLPLCFPENPPFAVEPNAGTPRQVARAWEAVIANQLLTARFKAEVRLIAKDAEIFGVGIGKWGWEQFSQKRLTYRRAAQPAQVASLVRGGKPTIVHTKESDEFDEVEVEETISRPFFCRREINHVMVAPGLREPDIRRAQFVAERDYMTIRDLNNLRGFEGFMIPPEEELKQLAAPPEEQAPSDAIESESTAFPAQGHRALPRYLDESENPLDHKLEVIEHWTSKGVIVVLQRKKVIRNQDNPFGIIPYVSCYWDDIPGTFYAFGIPRRIGGMQTHIQGLRNLRLDDINLNLQNVLLEKQGTNLTGQPLKLYPGARIKVSDPEGIKPLIKQPVLAEAWREEAVLVADAEKTTGANELTVQGAQPAQGRTSLGRTATGAGILGGASSARIQSFADVIADQVIIPTLYAFLKMDRLWLNPADIRKLIGQTLWQAMETSHDGDLLVDMCNNSDIQFMMLAGSSLSARRAMGQMLPLEMQLFMTPATQQGLMEAGLKVNWVEFLRRVEQVTGWRAQEDVLIPLSAQDIQRRMALSPEILKGKLTQQRIAQLDKGKQDLSAQEHQQKLQQIDAQGLAGAGQEIITRAIERSAQKAELGEISGTLGE